jgi:RNA polymerase sigma factor, sigma-70 family
MDNGAYFYQCFLDGDNNGLEELVKLYNANLIFYVNGFVNNITVSEDIAADTFAKLIIRKIRFNNTYMFKTWLFKIARNNAIDYLRKQSRWQFVSADYLGTEFADRKTLENTVLRNYQHAQLHNAMQTMHNDYRDVLHLVYFEDMSYVEVSAVLGKSSKQIKNLVYRAKQALRLALEKENFVYENA